MLIEADLQGTLLPSPIEKDRQAIYSSYFGFSEQPFSSLPKNEMFFSSASVEQMINTVTFALSSGEGVIKVTGESGVGKTYVLRQLLSSIGEDYYTIKILTPNISANVLLKTLIEELGAVYPIDANNAQLTKYLQFLLFEHYTKMDCRIIVWVDDAHKLPDETLEIISVLSNMETAHRSLFQFVLSGSTDLDEQLDRSSMIELKEKILFSASLKGLTLQETKNYLENRLIAAKAEDVGCFSRSALVCLYNKSSGIPRKINKLSHKALLLVFGKGDERVKRSHILKAARDDAKSYSIKESLFYAMFFLPMCMALVGIFFTVYLEWQLL